MTVEMPVPPEGTKVLHTTKFPGLSKVSFDLTTREDILSRFEFGKIQPGDAEATITVLDPEYVDPEHSTALKQEGWAYVEIRLLARSVYTLTEIEDDGR